MGLSEGYGYKDLTPLGRALEKNDALQKKLDAAIEFLDRLSHWDMLWTGEGQPSLVADGPYWKEQINKTLEKLRE
jgi:hypothetical protein